MAKPPIDPDSFDKINYVIDSWSTGCDAPWYIYIETMKPAALEAFIVLISFGWADVLRGRLRPKGLGRRTSKRKGRWNRKIPAFPEIGNTIGKNLPFAEQLEDYVKWGTKTRFLWRIDNLVQMGLFWWLVADVVEDFAFNWTSLLYESYWCQPDPPGAFSYTFTGPGAEPGGTWNLPAFPTEDYERPFPSWGFNNGTTGDRPAQITAAYRISKHPSFDPPGSLTVRIVAKLTGQVLAESFDDNTAGASEMSLPVSGLVPPNTVFEVRVFVAGTFAYVEDDGVVMGLEIKE